MSKVRIFELAKQLEISSKELLEMLSHLKIAAKSHASSIELADAEKAIAFHKKKRPVPIKEEKKGAPKKLAVKPVTKSKPEKRVAKEGGAPPPTKASAPSQEVMPSVVAPLPEKREKIEAAPPAPAVAEPPAPPLPEPTSEPSPLKQFVLTAASLTTRELADRLGVPLGELMKAMMKKGILANLNQSLDATTIQEVAALVGFSVETQEVKKAAVSEVVKQVVDEKLLVVKPPVVTILGHVDHGKTKLLDAIRKTNVIDQEAGGITQHIGAYQVEVHGRKITFLDTPGHEAFTALRARGAQVTDVAILLVAADDGVMPQTVEAIHHVKAANIPMVVAINKIDKPEANVDRVKQQLVEHELVPEEWGGSTVMVPISAKANKGIEELLEMILLVADIQELKANPKQPAQGIILEARLDRGRGPVATVLIADGTLHVGDPFYIGALNGKVRALFNDHHQRIEEAPPGTPVEVLGMPQVPPAGERLIATKSEREAKEHSLTIKAQEGEGGGRTTLEGLSKRFREGDAKDLNLIVKADVQGSLEALLHSLSKLVHENVGLHVLHSGTGAITESDVMLAKASQAIVVGFQVGYDGSAATLAENVGVDTRLYQIIYEMLDDIKLAVEGLLEPEYEEVEVGKAEVRQTFQFSKVGVIAGLYVLEGKLTRNHSIRVTRQGEKIYEGKFSALKRFKEDAKEVTAGFECGLSIQGFTNFQSGDLICAYERRPKVKTALEKR